MSGLDSSPSNSEILTWLQNRNVAAEKVIKMANTARPLYIITTNKAHTEKTLNTTNKFVCHTKVKWTRYVTKSDVTQCRRCQHFNHATAHCNKSPKCVKCGGGHFSGECAIAPKGTKITTPKCANCGEAHLASSRECKVLQKYIKSKAETNIVKTNINTQNKTFNTEEHRFPKLPTKPTKPMHAQHNINQGAATTQTNNYNRQQHIPPPTHTPGPQNIQDKFNNLNNAFETLNSLINIDRMTNLILELNSKLINCRNEYEQFMTYNQFYMTLSNNVK